MSYSETKQALELMGTALSVSGIYVSRKGRKLYAKILLGVYCLLVFIYMLSNLFRICIWFTVEGGFGPKLIRKVVQIAVNMLPPLVNVLLCLGFFHVGDFVAAVEHATDDVGKDDVDKLGWLLRRSPLRFTKVLVGTFLMIQVLAFTGYLGGIVGNSNMLESEIMINLLYPIKPDDHYIRVYATIFMLLTLYLSASWLMLCCLLTVITFILCQNFYAQGQRLRKHKEKFREQVELENPTPLLETERQCYESLINAVDVADSMLSLPLSTIVTLTVVSLSGIMYNIVYEEGDVILFGTDLSVVFISSSIVVILLIQCILLSWAAHSSKNILFSFDMRKLDTRSTLQIHLFILRSHGESLGLTFFKLFTMDQTAVTTIVGVLLTYSVVVLQFHPGGINDVRDACLALANLTTPCLTGNTSNITST